MRTTSSPNSTSSSSAGVSEAPAHDEPRATTGDAPASKSRRSFVFFGALATAAMFPKGAKAQSRGKLRAPSKPADAGTAVIQPGERAAAFAEWQSTPARLVRRTNYGITTAELTRANQLGHDGYLNYQLNYTRINDDAVETAVATKFPLLSQSSTVLFSADSGQLEQQLQQATIYRAAFSQRQLYHRMVEFWTDHFNQDYDKVQYLLVADQRDVIRAHALGKFPDLLKASAHSPSMMLYLDQNTSRNTAPNQNYAREIMELHTLGVDGGYTQTDVAELSRVLTGWTVEGRSNFTFNPAIHDWGAKTVLGVNIPAGSPSLGAAGINEGEQMLNVLANHPSTAKFIAAKMLRWLLDPNPSDAQIATVAATYRATGGDIKSMIRVILNESWLAASPLKFSRPFHFVAASLRATNPTVNTMTTINSQVNVLGHPIFTWDTPDGFPDKIEYWAGNILPRWSYGTTLSNLNSAATLIVDVAPYRAGSTAAAIDLINTNFFGGEMPLVTHDALTAYLNGGTFTDARMRETIALAIGANAFQWY